MIKAGEQNMDSKSRNYRDSPKTRFLAGLLRCNNRGIATGNPTSIVTMELMDKVRVYFPEANLKAELMAELAAAGHEILGFDTIMPSFSIQYESPALGCRVDWSRRDRMPDAVTHPCREVRDLKIPKNILEKPSLKVVLDAISILRKEYGDRVPILGKVMGPWTLSYHLAGVEEFLTWIVLDEGKLRRFLDILKEVSITYIRAQFQAGADAVTIADHATGDLIGPESYRDLLLPVHKEIVSRAGGPLILHICGNCYDRLRYFVEAGFDAYHFEWQVDAKKAVEAVDDEMALIGNISNKEILFSEPETIYKQVRYSVEAGVNVIGPECAVPMNAPLRNLKAITEAVDDLRNKR